MTYHGDEPEDTPSWVSNTQEWLTDLDRDPDYISEYDDSEPDFDEADYPPDPDDDPDVVADNPAENTTTTTDDNDNTDAAAGTVDADPVSAAVPGDGDGINPFDTNGTDGGAPELADHDSSPDDQEPPRYNKAIVGGFVAVVVVVALGITSAMLGMRRTPEVAPEPGESSIKVTRSSTRRPAAACGCAWHRGDSVHGQCTGLPAGIDGGPVGGHWRPDPGVGLRPRRCRRPSSHHRTGANHGCHRHPDHPRMGRHRHLRRRPVASTPGADPCAMDSHRPRQSAHRREAEHRQRPRRSAAADVWTRCIGLDHHHDRPGDLAAPGRRSAHR